MTRVESEKQEAIKRLRKRLRPGSTVYVVLKHCARSGMYRRIAVLALGKDQHKRLCADNISGDVADAIGAKWCDDGSVGVGGAGMDMGFRIVYSLGRVLFPKGGSLKHSPRAYQEREVGRETDGGYLLKHVWL